MLNVDTQITVRDCILRSISLVSKDHGFKFFKRSLRFIKQALSSDDGF